MKRTWKTSSDGIAGSIKTTLLPFLFVLTGAIFMLSGLERGEVGVVLRKAINICLECIGIG